MKKLATLLTDFTESDGYPAAMKGVMLSITPDLTLIDLSHTVPPQNVLAGAMLLNRCAPFFPAGTMHVCVVDPGVGTQRRGIIAQFGSQFYVGPDNGLISLVYRRTLKESAAVAIHSLENPAFMLGSVSNSFHGRDIFAPAAAHFLNGVNLTDFGAEVTDPVLLQIPEPIKTNDGWKGEILHIDAFGNLATTIRAENLALNRNIQIILQGQTIKGLQRTFGAGKPGDLVAIIDSDGYLSVCVVNGSAQRFLDAKAGDSIQIMFS